MERNELFVFLFKNFFKDLVTSLKPFDSSEERANFLEKLLEYLEGVFFHIQNNSEYDFEASEFDSNGFIRKEILHKFRDKAKPFLDTNLRLYFEKEEGLMTTLFKKLDLTEPILNPEEYELYTKGLKHILINLIEKILTEGLDTDQAEFEKEVKTLAENSHQISGFKSASKEYSRSRQILLFYYTLQLLGKGRLDISIRKNAQFAHALFAWPIDNIDNSAIYRMLKKAPNLKEDKNLIKDLEFVKLQFELIDSPEGVILVQKEIDSIKRS